MPRRAVFLPAIAFAMSTLAATYAAAVPLQRTFVASYGNDANPCSHAMPCRGFAAALARTIVGGEVIVLDSAGYGPVTITQSVSIVAPPGIYAGISVSTGTGILVSAGTGTVVLTGLAINGQGGAIGIEFQSGSALRIERTTVLGTTGAGLNAALSAAATLIIHDSSFGASNYGLFASGNSGALTVEIDGSRFEQNGYGAFFGSNVSGVISASRFSNNSLFGAASQPFVSGDTNNLTFRNCVFSANASAGIIAGGIAGTTNVLQLTDSEISDNNFGLAANLGTVATLSNTTVTRNGLGIRALNGSSVQSFQDNRLYGNSTDGSFTSNIGKL